MRALAALALAGLAPAALAYPLPVGDFNPAVFASGGGLASAFLTHGAWTASGGAFICAGVTYDILLAMVSQGDQAVALVLTEDRGEGCGEVWPPMLLRGNWADGWVGECTPAVGICPTLDVGPYLHGALIPVRLDGGNGLIRTGTVATPGT